MGNVRRAQSPARRLAAQTVRDLRDAAGLTQEACALKYGVGLRTLRDIEAGRCRMTALELVKELQLAAAAKDVNQTAEPAPLIIGPTRTQQREDGAGSDLVVTKIASGSRDKPEYRKAQPLPNSAAGDSAAALAHRGRRAA